MTGPVPRASYFEADDAEWKDHAACRHDEAAFHSLFFGSDLNGDGFREAPPDRDRRVAAARSLCAECPVSDECEAYAIHFGSEYGIWNGKPGIALIRRSRLKSVENEFARSKLGSGN
jgi:WhiB family redox-sensing transcriptional regulator